MFSKKDDQEDYIIGYINFLNCKIDLSKRPFIPRPETEFWISKVLDLLRKKEKKDIYCLDLFSGSGCIGISILKNLENTYCVFGEISDCFLEQIKINLIGNKINKKKYRIIKTDIFSNIENKFDCIFANPPYVAEERVEEVDEKVKKYEPNIALFGGRDGMFFIKKFLEKFRNYLKKGGLVFMEIDPDQKNSIQSFLKRQGNLNFEFWKDQFNKDRVVVIKN